jgi:hypothetical protein
VSCYNNLSWRVVISRRYDLPLRSFDTSFRDNFQLEPDHGSHSPNTDGNSLLHKAPSQPNQTQCVREIESPGSYQGGILSKTVPGHKIRLDLPTFEHSIRRNRSRQQSWLRILGEDKLLIGPLETQSTQGKAQRLIRFFEYTSGF